MHIDMRQLKNKLCTLKELKEVMYIERTYRSIHVLSFSIFKRETYFCCKDLSTKTLHIPKDLLTTDVMHLCESFVKHERHQVIFFQ